jgi:hypothetical protein
MMTAKRRPRGGSGRLAEIHRFLDEQGQRTLLDFAEFLAARAGQGRSEQLLEPRPEQRPARESVVAAIKRLSRSYYMLDRSAMLNETSSLMAAHVLKGRPASEVIDELESLFNREYAKYCQERQT